MSLQARWPQQAGSTPRDSSAADNKETIHGGQISVG